MKNKTNGTTSLWIPTALLKRLERAVPPSLRGGRLHKTRVQYALERFIEAEAAKDSKLAKAG